MQRVDKCLVSCIPSAVSASLNKHSESANNILKMKPLWRLKKRQFSQIRLRRCTTHPFLFHRDALSTWTTSSTNAALIANPIYVLLKKNNNNQEAWQEWTTNYIIWRKKCLTILLLRFSRVSTGISLEWIVNGEPMITDSPSHST